MISTKVAFLAAVVTSSAVAVSACGGSSAKTSSEPAPSASPIVTSAAPSAAATSAETSDATLPSGEALAVTVATLIIPTTTPAERSAQVIGGDDLTPTLTKLDAYLKNFKVTFKVSGQALTGKTLKGNVEIISNGKPFPKLYPSFWQQSGSTWELTRSGACSLIAVSGITCPDAPAS